MTLDTTGTLVAALSDFAANHRGDMHRFFHGLTQLDRRFLLRSEVEDLFAMLSGSEEGEVLANSPCARLVALCQEAATDGGWVHFALRWRAARWSYLRVHLDTMDIERIPVEHFLRFKETLVNGGVPDDWLLELDLEPFSREFQKLHEDESIGRGVEFLNRRLSSRLFEELGKGDRRLLDFLSVHQYRGLQLMLNETIADVDELRRSLRRGENLLKPLDPNTPWSDIQADLRGLGFEPGWGCDAGRTRSTMRLLLEILEAPAPDALETFLGRVPMIFSIAILSPHGFFGQSNVLGRPDTGGQVVYILDQVRALEAEMVKRLDLQGLDVAPQVVVLTRLIPEADGTGCDQRIEPIAGTRNAFILRVPFRGESGEVVPQWISRFAIWPYLERYALDAERELLAELGGRPDLIVGNYSDGNLVASLMSQRLGVTQCNIAHALEKTKYLYSDLYWQDNEEKYHFSSQFTADLIAMNTADFIITSTYQEIAGTEEGPGQYESYSVFTMPDLCRVVHGIDVYDPKFNIVSPGADADVYFPYMETDRRLRHLHGELDDLVFGDNGAVPSRGVLADRDKPLIFSMARMDRIKNITGLVEWFGRSEALRGEANLLVASGYMDPNRSADREERAEIERMHALIEQYGLEGQMRWVEMQVDRERNGELYRYVADRRGAFVQPALFEAFGLTVVEAMSSGLPTFATCFGGPVEIIEHGLSGFHIDPNHGDAAAALVADFFKANRRDPDNWIRVSQGGLDRIEERYTWRHYAERMMTLSKVYGFWKYVSHLERAETRRYLQMLYALQYRPLARRIGA